MWGCKQFAGIGKKGFKLSGLVFPFQSFGVWSMLWGFGAYRSWSGLIPGEPSPCGLGSQLTAP